MTRKDLTIVGVLAVVLIALMGLVIKSGGTQPPLPPTTDYKPPPATSSNAAALNAEYREHSDNKITALQPADFAAALQSGNNELLISSPAVDASAENSAAAAQPRPTPLELALQFQTALNDVDAEAVADSEESAFLLLSLFAQLPEDPQAEAELAEDLATAYLQSSDDDEKTALIDLLMIIPSAAAVRLGETLSGSSDPAERQKGLDLIANGQAPHGYR